MKAYEITGAETNSKFYYRLVDIKFNYHCSTFFRAKITHVYFVVLFLLFSTSTKLFLIIFQFSYEEVYSEVYHLLDFIESSRNETILTTKKVELRNLFSTACVKK